MVDRHISTNVCINLLCGFKKTGFTSGRTGGRRNLDISQQTNIK